MLKLDNIHFSYGDRPILNGITFEVSGSEVFGIIGPNGSGKTTLLRNISKLLNPSKGIVMLDGKQTHKMKIKDFAKIVSVVHQTEEYETSFTVKEVVSMGRNPHIDRFDSFDATDMEAVDKAMKLTDTFQFKDRLLGELSGGERQRVFIARAIAQETRIMVLDEPINHLDIFHQIEILRLIRKLSHDHGKMIVITLHDLNLAARYCDTLLLLKDGNQVSLGVPENIIDKQIIKDVYSIDANVSLDGQGKVQIYPEY